LQLASARVIREEICDGFEMKCASQSRNASTHLYVVTLTSAVLQRSGIQQAGAPETAVKSVTPCFYLWLVITSSYSEQ